MRITFSKKKNQIQIESNFFVTCPKTLNTLRFNVKIIEYNLISSISSHANHAANTIMVNRHWWYRTKNWIKCYQRKFMFECWKKNHKLLSLNLIKNYKINDLSVTIDSCYDEIYFWWSQKVPTSKII